MIRTIFLAIAPLILFVCPVLFGKAAAVEISAVAGASVIRIATAAHNAGAITSLTWNGAQFVDDFDHGRQCQSASSFDGRGEYFNPTEAGASYYTDGLNPKPSSSKSLYAIGAGNELATQTQMAYWYPVNGQKLSGHIHRKYVKIGAYGLAHVIEYRTEFEVPAGERHTMATFEVLTCYLPSRFSLFFTLDSGRLWRLSDGPGEQNKPIIFSTPNARHAMGIYSPGSPQSTYPEAGYGRWRHRDVVKWNNVYRIANPVGTYRFRSYVVVGDLWNVIREMSALKNAVEKEDGK